MGKLLGILCAALLVIGGCATMHVATQVPTHVTPQRLDNLSLDDLVRERAQGKVLLYGTVVGDVNTFTVETDDGRRYAVSQIAKDGKVRLFYFLDAPRDFTITRVWTEPGNEIFSMAPNIRVRWKGKDGGDWINSNALYVGRIELRFGDPKHFTGIRGKMLASAESQDRKLLQEALVPVLSTAAGSLPPVGQAP